MAKKNKSKKSPEIGVDDVLVRVDKKTADLIRAVSEEMGKSIRETARLMAWIGKKGLGRKIKIEEGREVLEVSLENYNKLENLEDKDVS